MGSRERVCCFVVARWWRIYVGTIWIVRANVGIEVLSAILSSMDNQKDVGLERAIGVVESFWWSQHGYVWGAGRNHAKGGRVGSDPVPTLARGVSQADGVLERVIPACISGR